MVILGIFSIGIFSEKGIRKNVLRTLLFLLTVALPISIPYAAEIPHFMGIVSIAYGLFFIFIFWKIIKFLIKPSYINIDIISASACGYLLLIEISVFLFQSFFYYNPASFKGIDITNTATTYMDFVYFCCITFTSIGFGDITPSVHYTKLATALVGIAGQFYSVVLVGILISKFSSKDDSASNDQPL